MDLSNIGSVPFSSLNWVPTGGNARQDKLSSLEKSMNERLERLSVK